MTSLAEQVRTVRRRVDREVGEAVSVGRAGQAAHERVAELRAAVELHERVAGILTRCGEERQEHAQRQIEGLVTRGLQIIFAENLTFHVVQGVRGGQAAVDFVVRSQYGDATVETPVLDARGGGLAAVVGFLLRLLVLLLTPGARRILFLDESFAHVSAEFEPRVAEFIREVCDRTGTQVVLITHSDAYSEHADMRYRLSLGADGMTEVSQG